MCGILCVLNETTTAWEGTMETIIYRAQAAIDAALAGEPVVLCKFADSEEGEILDLNPHDASAIAEDDPDLIYAVALTAEEANARGERATLAVIAAYKELVAADRAYQDAAYRLREARAAHYDAEEECENACYMAGQVRRAKLTSTV